MAPKTAAQPLQGLDARVHDALTAPVISTPHNRNVSKGFAHDARIVTTRGMRRVQELRVGDRLITRGNGVVAIDRLEQRSLVTNAVYFLAGSIGHHQPDRDSLLPAGQAVLVRDWRAHAFGRLPEVLATADTLIDGEYVRRLGMVPITLYSVFCGKPQVLYADGMELASADAMPT